MSERIILKEQLENVLQKNWATILDRNAFMKRVMSDAQSTELTQKITENTPPRQVKIVLTKFEIKELDQFTENPYDFLLWAEFTVPREQGVVVGTHIYRLDLLGNLELTETYGIHFVPESSVS